MVHKKVKHKKYGVGTAVKSRYNEFEYLVEFSSGIKRWLPTDELFYTYQKPLALIKKDKPIKPDRRFEYRRMVEAFKLGIVPTDLVDEFTFGRDNEIKKIERWLNQDVNNLLLIQGQYGSGKTHLLNYIKAKVLNDGYAVSLIEMHGKENPFHKPYSIYSKIVKNFRFLTSNKKEKDFRVFLSRASHRGAFTNHPYFKFINDKSDESTWEWIEAKTDCSRPTNYLDNKDIIPLYTNRMATNIYCNLISSLGYAAKEFNELKGLILIFDESEMIDYADYRYQIPKGKNFIQALSDSADNKEYLLTAPFDWKEKFESEYCTYRRGIKIPYLNYIPTNLKLIFSITTNPSTFGIDAFDNAKIIQLNELKDETLFEIGSNLSKVYNKAYEYKLTNTNTLFEKLLSNGINTRKYVKSVLEIFDLIKYNNVDYVLNEVLE